MTTTTHNPDTLKATYLEALAIKEAWDHRVTRATADHRAALAAGQGIQEAQNNLNAATIQQAEAVGYMGTALDAWLDAIDTIRHRASMLTLSAQNTTTRLHAHRRH